jgi:type IV secretory pathway VirB10-like protein
MNTVSANQLTAAKPRSRLTTMNIGLIIGIIGIAGLIELLLIQGVSSGNASNSNVVTGAPPITGGSHPDDINTGPSPAAALPTAAPIVAATTNPEPLPTQTAAQQAPPAQASGGGGGDDGAAEARRQALEHRRQLLEQIRKEKEDAAASGGAVAMPQSQFNNGTGAGAAGGNIAYAGTMNANGTVQPGEYAPPAGPVLPVNDKLPVAFFQNIDSTFGGQFGVQVNADIKDETNSQVILPNGSWCFAQTTAGGVDGQDRIYATVNMCKLPNRMRLALDNFPLIDVDGATGLKAHVDDHGAGRRNRSSALINVPGMLGGIVPGAGIVTGVASGAAATAQAAQVGRAYPGPTLTIEASSQKPRYAYIYVPRDTVVRAYADTFATPAPQGQIQGGNPQAYPGTPMVSPPPAYPGSSAYPAAAGTYPAPASYPAASGPAGAAYPTGAVNGTVPATTNSTAGISGTTAPSYPATIRTH